MDIEHQRMALGLSGYDLMGMKPERKMVEQTMIFWRIIPCYNDDFVFQRSGEMII